jgi:predicted GIY-YIG superfamily endonuclease
MTSQMEYIYVLKLKEGKFYVGKSDNVMRRLQEHVTGSSSCADWTRRYGVENLIYVQEQKCIFDEDNKVKELMMKHGFDNVRGGAYSRIDLTPEEVSLLKKEFAGALGLCYNCGRAGHYIGDCEQTGVSLVPRVSFIPDAPLPIGATSSNSEVHSRTKVTHRSSSDDGACRRCGRNTHSHEGCNAKTTIDGKPICSRCGRTTHVATECKLKTDFLGKKL